MQACHVEIVTRTEGKITRFRARGSLDEESLALSYTDGGDAVTLTFSSRSLVMARRGETELSARFEEGKETDFLLCCGGKTGIVPVRTALCALRRENEGFSVALEYILRFSSVSQRFLLDIIISDISEEE